MGVPRARCSPDISPPLSLQAARFEPLWRALWGVYRQMLSDLGFSSRVDELKIELKRLPAIKKARKRR